MTCSQLSSTSSVSAVGEHVDQPADRVARLDVLHAASRDRARPDGVEHRPGHVGGVGDRRQLDQPGAAADALGEPGRGDRGEPGLARAARADQGDQPVLGELLGDLAQLLVATDETAERGAQVAEAGRRRFGLAAQHRQVGGAQLGGRVGAELVGEPAAERLVGRERLGRPPGRGERLEPQRAEAFPQRVVAGELFELGDQGRAPGRDPAPPRRGPRWRPAAARRGGPRRRPRSGPRPASAYADPRQSASPSRRVSAAVCGSPARSASRPARASSSKRWASTVGAVEPVAALCGDHAGAGNGAAQAGDQGLDGVALVRRGTVGPEGVDERVDADHPAGVGGEPGQERAQPRPADLDGGVVNRHLERAEDPHLHGSTLSPARIRSR